MSKTPTEAQVRRDFDRWWEPLTKAGKEFYGCSENWGAWQAYQKGRFGKVLYGE